ncbi:MAG: SRPBCC domain-containing protein, partial [Bacteroidia bacterium]|nr:SRPBCC domain-containing protein [Bacteroidia bacterium]
MNSTLLFDFVVNKEKNSIHVTREFAAPSDTVWEAWTNPEILDKWWAPKPYYVKTKSMDFREGGTWLYAMIGPENDTHWCRADYKKITQKKNYSYLDAFCDENGKINTDMPRTSWNVGFKAEAETTVVNVDLQYNSLEDLEKVIQLGFKEGFGMAMDNLDQYIKSRQKLRSELRISNKARVCTYLNFPGNTEEAFNFYKKVFRSEFSGKGIQYFGDIPAGEGQPPVAESVKKMVLHVELPILGGHVLMATDAPKEMGFTLTSGNNMHISLEPETREEAKRLFDELSAGGKVTMPLQDMFFGSYFGEFTDKYGITWMVNYVN